MPFMGFEEKKELLKEKSPLLGVARQGSGSISSRDDRSRENETQKRRTLKRKSKRAGTFGFKTQGIFDNTVSLEWGKLTVGI